MRLFNEQVSGAAHGRVLANETVYDLARLHSGDESAPPLTTSALLAAHGMAGLAELKAALDSEERRDVARVGDVGDIDFLPAVTDPEKIIGVGLNYADHAAEVNRDLPEYPVLFAKFRNSLAAHGRRIKLPAASEKVDYEGELGVVIGEECAEISSEEALSRVAAVTIVNDISARDLQNRTHQWLAGKAVDEFLPCGPWLVTLDELPELSDLRLTTRVNGETVQDASIDQMIFDVPTLIASISQHMTLVPGDLILTGTPAGVGSGRKPPLWLDADSEVEVEISGIGVLANTFRD